MLTEQQLHEIHAWQQHCPTQTASWLLCCVTSPPAKHWLAGRADRWQSWLVAALLPGKADRRQHCCKTFPPDKMRLTDSRAPPGLPRVAVLQDIPIQLGTLRSEGSSRDGPPGLPGGGCAGQSRARTSVPRNCLPWRPSVPPAWPPCSGACSDATDLQSFTEPYTSFLLRLQLPFLAGLPSSL